MKGTVPHHHQLILVIPKIPFVPGFMVPSELVLCYFCATLGHCHLCQGWETVCLGSDIPEGLVPCPPEVLLSDPQWPSPATQLTEKSEPLLDLGDFPFSLFNHTAFCLFPPEEELLASCHQGVQAVQKHEAGRRYLLVRKSEMGRASLLAGRRRR